MMTRDDIQEIRDLLNDESDKWRLDVGDWIGYVEELVDEVEKLRNALLLIVKGKAEWDSATANLEL